MNTRIEIADLLRALSASMIYVTHAQTEAKTLADKIVVQRDGRVGQVAAPMELYNNPCNRFVAGFLGSPAMNFLEHVRLDIPIAGAPGIRPEQLHPTGEGRIRDAVTHVERLGGDTNLLVATDQAE